MTIQFTAIIISMAALPLIGVVCFHIVMIKKEQEVVAGCYQLIDASCLLDILPFKEAN